MVLLYKHFEEVTSKITVDFKMEKVSVENYCDDPMDTAFGVIKNPTMKDFEDFLEDRCFPRTRDKMKLHLRELGIDYYDPLQIVMKTGGRLEGDYYSIEIIEM